MMTWVWMAKNSIMEIKVLFKAGVLCVRLAHKVGRFVTAYTCCRFLRFLALGTQRGSAVERAGLQRQLITAERGHCCGLPCLSSSRLNSYTLYRSDQQQERTKHTAPCTVFSTGKIQPVNSGRKKSRHVGVQWLCNILSGKMPSSG